MRILLSSTHADVLFTLSLFWYVVLVDIYDFDVVVTVFISVTVCTRVVVGGDDVVAVLSTCRLLCWRHLCFICCRR